MFRLNQALTHSDRLARHVGSFFPRPQPALAQIPIAVEPTDVPQRLSSRRRKSRVTVQIHGV